MGAHHSRDNLAFYGSSLLDYLLSAGKLGLISCLFQWFLLPLSASFPWTSEWDSALSTKFRVSVFEFWSHLHQWCSFGLHGIPHPPQICVMPAINKMEKIWSDIPSTQILYDFMNGKRFSSLSGPAHTIIRLAPVGIWSCSLWTRIPPALNFSASALSQQSCEEDSIIITPTLLVRRLRLKELKGFV